MRVRANADYWRRLAKLPVSVRRRAQAAYRQFLANPYHPSLQFKRVTSTEPVYSVRITESYRAVGLWEGDQIVWFWIGTHAEYDALLSRL